MRLPASERIALGVPPLATLAVFLLWAASGGYPPTVWYPGAIFLLGLLLVVRLAHPALVRGVPRATAVALGFLACFTAWCFLSIAWADVQGDAWDGANRTLLYLTVFAFFALWPWRPGDAALWLGALAVGIAAVGVVVVARAAGDPASAFVDGRLGEPSGYSNATCALFLVAFWPALFLASRRETPLLARALTLAAAGALLELALLTQSRGSLVAFPLALVLFLVLVPGRLRSLVALAAVAAAVLPSLGALLDVYAEDAAPGSVRAARTALLLSAAGLAAAGLALALLDRRVPVPERLTRGVARGLAALAAAGILAGVVVGLLAVEDPTGRVSNAWEEFKSGEPAEFGASHFTGGGLGSGRYDEWRVAVGEFRSAPLHGIGMDNFAVPYLRERKTGLEPRYPHSFPLAILSQTGIVGAALFLGFLAAALASAKGAAARSDRFGAGLIGAAVTSFGYWALHGSADWFWEFPGLGAVAFACLGLAAGVGRPMAISPEATRARSVAATLVAGALALAALASYAAPWLAARELGRAADRWEDDPPVAFAGLDRARRLNPLSDRPDLVTGAIAMRLEDYGRAAAAFERVLDHNPQNWYAHLELAMIEALDGRRGDALARLERARALNPSEEAIGVVRTWIEQGEPVSPAEIDRLLLERVESRTGLQVLQDG